MSEILQQTKALDFTLKETPSITDNTYLSLFPEFILKNDGNRPIVYPLDYNNTQIYFLTPIEGFCAALLNGDKPFKQIKEELNFLFPSADKNLAENIIFGIDQKIRSHPSQNGYGAKGLFKLSYTPEKVLRKNNPLDFIVDSSLYEQTMNDYKRMRRLESPINIYTIFTHSCFTNCKYCYAERKHVKEMSFDRWKEIIAEMKDLDIHLASPDNGDTFARKEGINFLECLLENDMLFLLSTKAYVSKDYISRLVDAGLKKRKNGVIERMVQLSIDAVDNEIAKDILNIRKSRVGLITKTFDNFMSVGIMPIIKAVITGLNVNQPGPIVDHFYKRGARRFSFVHYTRSFYRHSDDLFVKEQHLPELRKQFAEIREKYPDIDLNENLTYGTSGMKQLSQEQKELIWKNRIGCGGGWYSLGISADGKAFLCEQMVMNENVEVGDANHQSIMEIWNSKKLKDFIYPERNKFKGTICFDCEEFEECIWKQGRCYRDAYFSYGSIYTATPMCPKNRTPGLKLS